MKNRILLSILFYLVSVAIQAQVVDIAIARSYSEGTTVTVRGLVLNGSELGPIRYMQDATGAIAAYDFSATADVLIGDSIEVTGVLYDYNSLLEISPITSLTILNSGNPLPTPEVVTLTGGWSESYEAKLVKTNAVTFTESGTFSSAGSGTNYDITDGSTDAQLRVVTTTNIDGTLIPEEEVFITGIMSQYAPGGSGGYQLLPRSLADISTGGNPPVISTPLTQSNITNSSFTVGFETLYEGNTLIHYGLSAGLLNLETSDETLTTSHQIDLTGLSAGTIYYVQGISISPSGDSSFSPVVAMATASNSSGEIRVWFNNPVDNGVSTGTNAVYNPNFVDTIISFIDQALYSIDMAVYNIDNENNIVTALNDAYQRGVTVRVICDSEVNSTAYSLLNIGPGNKILSPSGTTPDGSFYGIQHNKFIVIDAASTNPNDQWVISGSTNFTNDQLLVDKQNMIAFQDQTLAKAYRLEFEEMFSGKFGPEKTNNTPHEFVIGGKRVELYFSPSDDTETQIKKAIQSADHDLYFAVFSFTRFGISYEIEDAVERGVFAAGIWEQTDVAEPLTIEILESATGETVFESMGSVLFHHKYLIVDPQCPQSDALVLTGSHNWTSSANSRNDENTLIIHDSTLANIYYQEFSARYSEEGGSMVVGAFCEYVSLEPNTPIQDIYVYPNPAIDYVYIGIPADLGNSQIILSDMLGREVKKINSTVTPTYIDLSNMVPGIYTMMLLDNEQKPVGIGRIILQP